MELGCRDHTPSQKLEAEALPGCPCGMADAGVFCGNGVLSRAVVQGGGAAGDTWSIRGRPPWNVLTKIGEPANCFSWRVLL